MREITVAVKTKYTAINPDTEEEITDPEILANIDTYIAVYLAEAGGGSFHMNDEPRLDILNEMLDDGGVSAEIENIEFEA